MLGSIVDILIFLVGILFVTTSAASLEYFRQLRKAQKEYEQAKEVVEDIIISFNRQIENEAKKLEITAYQVEANSSKVRKVSDEITEVGTHLRTITQQIDTSHKDKEDIKTKLIEMNEKIQTSMESYTELMSKVSNLEQKAGGFQGSKETRINTVIPIRRKRALAPLTRTELAVLEKLVSEGPMTAPKIRNEIKLSREHTARLMKKLYDEGYLERDTSKIPFRYWSKKEMEKLLKNNE
jgi:chromosome segregation ATPase